MQFDMEPIGLPSPSRTYQAVQKCCHGTWWLFGMVAIGVALRIADCPLYNFCCLVETIAPKKLTWVPVFIIYIYITCMPIIPVPYAIPSHFDSSWFLQRDTSPSCRWDQLRFPTAAGSRPGACKLARQDDGICLRTCIYTYEHLHAFFSVRMHSDRYFCTFGSFSSETFFFVRSRLYHLMIKKTLMQLQALTHHPKE